MSDGVLRCFSDDRRRGNGIAEQWQTEEREQRPTAETAAREAGSEERADGESSAGDRGKRGGSHDGISTVP